MVKSGPKPKESRWGKSTQACFSFSIKIQLVNVIFVAYYNIIEIFNSIWSIFFVFFSIFWANPIDCKCGKNLTVTFEIDVGKSQKCGPIKSTKDSIGQRKRKCNHHLGIRFLWFILILRSILMKLIQFLLSFPMYSNVDRRPRLFCKNWMFVPKAAAICSKKFCK